MSQAQEPLFSAEQWHKLRASIDRVDALPANAREVELERIAAADPELARAMRDFADADAVPDELPPLAPAIAAANAMPAQVGSFHLLREIGVGGMGVVYLAERQGPDFTQRVALKLLDGGASRMARLAARERNILAALAHPLGVVALLVPATLFGWAGIGVAVAIHEGSTLVVVVNALRLLAYGGSVENRAFQAIIEPLFDLQRVVGGIQDPGFQL